MHLNVKKGMSMSARKLSSISKSAKMIFLLACTALAGCDSDNNSAELIKAVELESQINQGTLIESLTIIGDHNRLRADESHQLSAIGIDSNGESRDVTDELTWVSSDVSIATVDNKGLVTAILNSATNHGIITITATTINGISDEGEMSISDAQVTNINLKQTSPEASDIYTCIDASIKGDVTYEDGYISYNTVKDMSFSLDENSSAVIDDNGNIYTSAEAIEITTITATISAETADVTDTLTVTADPTYLSDINILVDDEITTLITLNIGERLQANGQANFDSAVSEDSVDIDNSIIWSQEDVSKIGITAIGENKGTVYALKPGVTQLIGSCGGMQSNVTLEIKGDANLDEIQINDGSDIIELSPLASIELTLLASYINPTSSMNVSEFALWDIHGSNLLSVESIALGTDLASYKLTSTSSSSGIAIVSVTYDGITRSVRIIIE